MAKGDIPQPPRNPPGASTLSVPSEAELAMLACLAELKILVASNNDSVALALISAQLLEMCEKLLAQAEQNEQITSRLESMLEQLSELCTKIESGNAETLACLGEIKTAQAATIASLELLCTKSDATNAELGEICTKLDSANVLLADLGLKLDALLAVTTEAKRCNTLENEMILECLRASKNNAPIGVCLTSADGSRTEAIAHIQYGMDAAKNTTQESVVLTDVSGEVPYSIGDFTSATVGACKIDRVFFDTCFLPDQYAVQWAWAGNGQLQSYDPITGEWTEHGQTVDPATGAVVGGFALAFKNDALEPVIYFQVRGMLYRADPSDPIGTFQQVGPTLPAAPGSYPCFAFDPSGRLLAGIGTGSTVIEIDPVTGAATNIGQLIDVRDGAALSAGPGDWYFDPAGDWFMMAKDNRGTALGESCIDTVLFKIDPATLEAVRVSKECSPVSGTGAEWLAAGLSLLSHSNGTLSQYNAGSGEWSAFADPAPQAINDLSAQWIVPQPIKVFGFVDKDKPVSDRCEQCLFTMAQNPVTFELECKPFELKIPGTFGKCEADANPFITDPFDAGSSDSAPRSDQVWNLGCSDAGPTLWRKFYDSAGNSSTEYKYGSLQESTALKPSGFSCFECGKVVLTTNTIAHCDNDLNKTVYLKEKSDGSTFWFDESGEIAEPENKSIGECLDNDALLPVSEQVVCLDGSGYIRTVKEQYVEDLETGLPELQNYQVLFYNEEGIFYDSGVIPPSTPADGEPVGWTFGECVAAQPPCSDFIHVGNLWKFRPQGEVGTKIEWWGRNEDGVQAAAHDTPSNIFQLVDGTYVHPNGAPTASYLSSEFGISTSRPEFYQGVGMTSSSGTNGLDQVKLSGYVNMPRAGVVSDVNVNTGERGLFAIQYCCKGDLVTVAERDDDSGNGDSAIFTNVGLPEGIHYVEIMTSDVTAWQGMEFALSLDGGITTLPFISSTGKPFFECVPVIKCKDTGQLFNAATDETITVEFNDSWCEPKCETP